jgi:predicted PurR-regulated permease PerM
MASPAGDSTKRSSRRTTVAPRGELLLVRPDPIAVGMVVVGVLVAFAVLAIFRAAPVTITQLGVGALLGFALDPLVGAVRRRLHCSRAAATVVVGSGLAAGFAVIALLLGPRAIEQASQFAEELPQTVEELYSWPVVGPWLEDADAVGRVETFVEDLPTRLDDETVASLADRIAGGIGTLVIVLVTALAVMFDGDAIVARLRRLVPPSRRERADEVGRIVYRSVGKYFAGSLTVAAMNGMYILTLGIVLGVPLAPLAAIWAAITNLIPQVGGFLGGSFFVVLAVTEGPLTGLIALAGFLAYQQIENNVIQPAIIGKAINLTPPTTMLAALIGGAAAGVPGALAATPLVAATKSVYLDLRGRPDPEDADGDGQADEPGGPIAWVRRKISRARSSGSG